MTMSQNKDGKMREIIIIPTHNKRTRDIVSAAESAGLTVSSVQDNLGLHVRGYPKVVQKVLENPAALLGISIENIVATLNLGQEVNLTKLTPLLGAQYNKDRFPGLVFRPPQETQATFLIFKSGTVVCVGANSEKNLKAAADILYAALTKVGVLQVPVTEPVKVVNIVAQVILKGKINIERAVRKLTGILYEPILFPGAIYRITDPHPAIFLLFKSGKVICLKTRTVRNLESVAMSLDTTLRTNALLYSEARGIAGFQP